MSLTRKMLTAMGIEAEKIDQIIESHTETVDGLKKVADDLREQAGKVPDLERKIGELEKAQPTEDYEGKFKDLKAEFDTYKEKVAAEQAQAEKARLYRSLLREAGIDEKRLDAIMRVTDLSGVTVEDGAIVDAETVSEQIKKDWEAFIPQIDTRGAQVPNPPDPQPTADGADPNIVKRLQERHERLYGKSEDKE